MGRAGEPLCPRRTVVNVWGADIVWVWTDAMVWVYPVLPWKTVCMAACPVIL